MASPVGVPLPSGVSIITCPVTAAALLGAIGTGTSLVTEAAVHSLPSPSGNALRPHEIEASVAVTTSLTAGTTKFHLLSLPVLPLGFSFIDPERSSKSKISAGCRLSFTSCRAHSPFITSPASGRISGPTFNALPLPPLEGAPPRIGPAPPALPPVPPLCAVTPLPGAVRSLADEHASRRGTNNSEMAEVRVIGPRNAAPADFDHSTPKFVPSAPSARIGIG